VEDKAEKGSFCMRIGGGRKRNFSPLACHDIQNNADVVDTGVHLPAQQENAQANKTFDKI
jgi:hypothetical protein